MQKLSVVIRRLERLRSLVGSTSTAMKAATPDRKPSSNPCGSSYGHFAHPKISSEKLVSEHGSVKADLAMARIKQRARAEVRLLEENIEQAVSKHSKLKVKQNEDLKIDQGLDWASIKTLCDQLAETLHQLANYQTEEAEEDNKFPEEMLENNSKALDKLNCLLRDLSTKLESEEENDASEKMFKNQAAVATNVQPAHRRQKIGREPMSLLEGKLLQTVNGDANVKKEQQILDLKISSLKTLCNQLTETLDQVVCPTETGHIFGGGYSCKPVIDLTESRCNETVQKNSFEWYQMHCKKNCGGTRLFHSSPIMKSSKKKKRAKQTEDTAPGNTATIVLDSENLPASMKSYRKGIRKVRKWCRANSKVHDLSHHYGPGAEVYTTPTGGTFHLSFVYKERRITFFIYGTNLYLMGWESDECGMFEMKLKDEDQRFIPNPACRVLKIGVNYNHLVDYGEISGVRLGPLPMMEKFDVLHKCNSVSDEAKKAIALFVVNISEAIRIECIFKKILRSFANPFVVFKLGEVLAKKAKNYGRDSREYLTCLDYIIRRQAIPKIQNRAEANIKSVDELRTIIVPLRTVYNFGEFKYDKLEPYVWSPPYPDGKDWVPEEEDGEEDEEDWIPEEEDEEGGRNDEIEEDHQHDKEQEDHHHCEEEKDPRGKKLLISSFSHHFPVLKMTGILSRMGTRSGMIDEEPQQEEEQEEERDEEQEEDQEEEQEETEQDVKEAKKLWSSYVDPFPVLKMTGSLSRFTERATSGRITFVGQYCLSGTSTAGHRGGTSSGLIKVVEVIKSRPMSYSICKQAWRTTRFLRRLM